MKSRIVVAVFFATFGLFGALWAGSTANSPSTLPSEPTPFAGGSFIFGAVGDLGGPSNGDMAALSKRLAASGASFLISLGDLGYTTDEPGWCSAVKSGINDVLLIAGNHDTGESSGGDIAEFVRYCPYTLDAALTAGPGTPGYGYEYYFDYPAASPLARFILHTAGTRGSTNYAFSPGSSHWNFVIDAVTDAKATGLWVIVGQHKVCINAGHYGCEIGQAFFDKLIELKVDIMLQAHYHSYQRSKQLALNAACPTVRSNGGFDADCVVDDGSDDRYAGGSGTVVVTNGAGGNSLYDIGFGTDPEMGYMVHVMGRNGNSKGLSAGYGAAVFTVSATGIQENTDFCPSGTTDGSGHCHGHAGSVFWDSFAIGSPPPPPPPPVGQTTLTLVTGANPSAAGENVTVSGRLTNATSGAGLAGQPVLLEWSWDQGTWTREEQIGQFTTDLQGNFADTMAFRGTTDHTEYIRARFAGNADSLPSTSPIVSQQIVVRVTPAPDSSPPVTTSSASGAKGASEWYRSAVSVTLTATDDQSGIAFIQFRLNGGAWQTYSTTLSVDGDGTHTIDYYAMDGAGNAESMRTVTIRIDTVPPTTTAQIAGTLAPDESYISSVNVTLIAGDALSGVASVQYRVDGGVWWTYTGPFPLSGDGTHTLDYSSADLAGNTGFATTSIVRVSGSSGQFPTTAAHVTGTSGRNGWYITSAEVALTATSPTGRDTMIGYSIGGVVWKIYTGPFTVFEGRYSVIWQSVDVDGRFESPKSMQFDVDLTDPYVLDLAPQGTVQGPEVTVDWTGYDLASGIAGYEVSIDGGPFEPVGLTRTLARTWEAGLHHVEVRATDHAGRVSPVVGTDFTVLAGGDVSLPGLVQAIPLYFPAIGLGLLAVSYVLIRRRRHKGRRELRVRFDPDLDSNNPSTNSTEDWYR